jgi:hypothetical protein
MGRRIPRDAHVVDLFDVDSSSAQTVLNRTGGKAGAVLDAIETLFFDSGHKPAVFD